MPHPHEPGSPWGADEVLFLRQNVERGAAWMHRRMPWRSEKAIRHKAERLRISWKEPGRVSEMCPECYENRIVPGSYAARLGICPACYQRERERKFRQLRDEEEARARAEAARQAYYRARRRKGDA